MSFNFIKKRILDILDLKRERHFIPGFILGFYAITMLSTLMTYWTFLFFGKIENPFFDLLMPYGALFMPTYMILITIIIGKEIIWCHMMILRQVDHLTKWIMNKYSISYYKKYKKDPPFLGFISKIQYKIFSKVMRITPRGKKKIIVSAVSIWAVWFVFGRTDAVEFIIVEIEKQMMIIQEWNILSLF